MVCLDTVCLVANFPLEETFENCEEDLFSYLIMLMTWKKRIYVIFEKWFYMNPSSALKKTHYEQINGLV